MALPRELDQLIGSIVTQTDVERRLLRAMTKRLESSLAILEKTFSRECAQSCFRHLMDPLFTEQNSASIDLYEKWVERCVRLELDRPLTEGEEELLGEVLNHITGITEMLCKLAGMELADDEDEDEENQGIPAPQ